MTKESAVFAYCTSDNRIKVVDALDFKQNDDYITFKVRINNKDYYMLYVVSTQALLEYKGYLGYEPSHIKVKSIERVITEHWSVK